MEKNKKIKAITIMLFAIAVVSLTGCISDEPIEKPQLTPYEITDAKLAAILGYTENEISDMIKDLNVEVFYINYTEGVTFDTLWYDYELDYVSWVNHINKDINSTEVRVSFGAWRKLITINAIVIAEGLLVETETNHDCIVMTSYGTLSDYNNKFEGFY